MNKQAKNILFPVSMLKKYTYNERTFIYLNAHPSERHWKCFKKKTFFIASFVKKGYNVIWYC